MNDIFALGEGMTLQNGKYTIVHMLSHGGFGVTYRARHEKLNIDVCIKEFFPQTWCNRDAFSYEVTASTTGNVEVVDRFMRKFVKEAQSLAALRHGGIVNIHDVFEENGTAYYVMDFIEGHTLQDIVKSRGPLPLGEALGYIRQAGDALSYLHGRNMNHLDIKPANMMVDASGRLTLIDFGLAKNYDADGHQTTTTPLCISRGYSPLEQYKDGGVSRFASTADIYPLAATLYYLLTGTTPPEATELVTEDLTMPATIPPHIAAAITHAMSPKAAQRPQSVAAFLSELIPASQAHSAATTPIKKPAPAITRVTPTKPQAPRYNRTSIIILIAFLLIAAGLGTYLYLNHYNGDPNAKKLMADTAMVAGKEEAGRPVESDKEPIEAEAPKQTESDGIQNDTVPGPAIPVTEYGRTKLGKTGELLTKKGGKYYYFTTQEWSKLPDKSSYTKLGVVVNASGCAPFYVSLFAKDNGRKMTWNEAVSRYGEGILPSGAQCRAMGANYKKIKSAIKAFGGDKNTEGYFWGKEYDSPYAWFVNMTYGNVANTHFNTPPKRVRAVAPVPVASAK